MGDGREGLAAADDTGADTTGTGKVVRHADAGPRLDGVCHGGSPGAGSFVDEAHFRADSELRGKWVLKGEPALVDSTSPKYGEKASYYSAVFLEMGEVEWMGLEGNSNSGTSVACLKQLKNKHPGPLKIILFVVECRTGVCPCKFRTLLGPGWMLSFHNPCTTRLQCDFAGTSSSEAVGFPFPGHVWG